MKIHQKVDFFVQVFMHNLSTFFQFLRHLTTDTVQFIKICQNCDQHTTKNPWNAAISPATLAFFLYSE